jgi:hypothetical protein
MNNSLYIEWNDPLKKVWRTVGKLSKLSDRYSFEYTKGALESEKFVPFGLMTALDTTYESEELFPLFANRLLNQSRPEYFSFLEWLNMDKDSDPLSILSVSQGVRGTDSLRVFSLPDMENGVYKSKFFVSGISHVDSAVSENFSSLKVGTPLYIMDDIQNEFPNALALRTLITRTVLVRSRV